MNNRSRVPIVGQPKHRIVIEYDPATEQVTCNGPIQNSLLFLGMLDMARISFLEHRLRSGVRTEVVPPPPDS